MFLVGQAFEQVTGCAREGFTDAAFVQNNPTWSPDGKTTVFARSATYDLKHTSGQALIAKIKKQVDRFRRLAEIQKD